MGSSKWAETSRREYALQSVARVDDLITVQSNRYCTFGDPDKQKGLVKYMVSFIAKFGMQFCYIRIEKKEIFS